MIPFEKSEKAEAYNEAYAFNADHLYAMENDCHSGYLPAEKRFIKLKGDYIRSSALKLSENGDCAIMRIYNISNETQKVDFAFNEVNCTAVTNLAENDDAEFNASPILPKKIMTYKIK